MVLVPIYMLIFVKTLGRPLNLQNVKCISLYKDPCLARPILMI